MKLLTYAYNYRFGNLLSWDFILQDWRFCRKSWIARLSLRKQKGPWFPKDARNFRLGTHSAEQALKRTFGVGLSNSLWSTKLRTRRPTSGSLQAGSSSLDELRGNAGRRLSKYIHAHKVLVVIKCHDFEDKKRQGSRYIEVKLARIHLGILAFRGIEGREREGKSF